MTFWLITALVGGLAVGVFAHQEGCHRSGAPVPVIAAPRDVQA